MQKAVRARPRAGGGWRGGLGGVRGGGGCGVGGLSLGHPRGFTTDMYACMRLPCPIGTFTYINYASKHFEIIGRQ